MRDLRVLTRASTRRFASLGYWFIVNGRSERRRRTRQDTGDASRRS
jgi:hypothetical protein